MSQPFKGGDTNTNDLRVVIRNITKCHKNHLFCVNKLGFCIFHIFKMIARCSKYDFWIPGKILSWNIKNSENKIYFFKSKNKISTKKSEHFRDFLGKSKKLKILHCVFNVKISDFLDFQKNLEIFPDLKKTFSLKKIFSFLNFFYSNSKFCQESKNHTYKTVQAF